MKRINVTGKMARIIRDTGRTEPLLDARRVAESLEAEPIGAVETGSVPASFVALREEIAKRLTSTGGRPALEGTARRQKIPLNEEDWSRLCELAGRLEEAGPRATPAQVASALLHRLLSDLDLAGAQFRSRSDQASGRRGEPRRTFPRFRTVESYN